MPRCGTGVRRESTWDIVKLTHVVEMKVARVNSDGRRGLRGLRNRLHDHRSLSADIVLLVGYAFGMDQSLRGQTIWLGTDRT